MSGCWEWRSWLNWFGIFVPITASDVENNWWCPEKEEDNEDVPAEDPEAHDLCKLTKDDHLLLTAVTPMRMRTTRNPAAAPETRITVGENSVEDVLCLECMWFEEETWFPLKFSSRFAPSTLLNVETSDRLPIGVWTALLLETGHEDAGLSETQASTKEQVLLHQTQLYFRSTIWQREQSCCPGENEAKRLHL